MLGDKTGVQSKVVSDYTDEQPLFVKQMGMKHVYVIFKDGHTDYDPVMRFTERLRELGPTIADVGNVGLYKNDKVHLGLEGRDKTAEDHNNFNRVLGKAGIFVVYMTWEPNQVLTIALKVSRHTRGEIGCVVDIDEPEECPYTHGRLYTKEEMRDNLKYFLDRTLPVCEEANVKIVLRPSDPPVDCLVGISNPIVSAEDCKYVLELAGSSPYLRMKMRIGCWPEGRDKFGNVMEGVQYFVENKKVLLVHFGNVSGTIPYFKETLPEDEYTDMYGLMKRFVRYDYDGVIHMDHVPVWGESVGGENSSWAYCTGHMKALLNCAGAELNR